MIMIRNMKVAHGETTITTYLVLLEIQTRICKYDW